MARTIIHAVTKDGQAAAIQRAATRRPMSTRMYSVRLEGRSRAVLLSRSCLKLLLRTGARILGRLQTWE